MKKKLVSVWVHGVYLFIFFPRYVCVHLNWNYNIDITFFSFYLPRFYVKQVSSQNKLALFKYSSLKWFNVSQRRWQRKFTRYLLIHKLMNLTALSQTNIEGQLTRVRACIGWHVVLPKTRMEETKRKWKRPYHELGLFHWGGHILWFKYAPMMTTFYTFNSYDVSWRA